MCAADAPEVITEERATTNSSSDYVCINQSAAPPRLRRDDANKITDTMKEAEKERASQAKRFQHLVR